MARLRPCDKRACHSAEGRLELTIGKDVLIAEEGDEVFIPRQAVHSVRNINTADSIWLFGYDS